MAELWWQQPARHSDMCALYHSAPHSTCTPLSIRPAAQVCMMVGVKPVPDALGRVNKLEVRRQGR